MPYDRKEDSLHMWTKRERRSLEFCKRGDITSIKTYSSPPCPTASPSITCCPPASFCFLFPLFTWTRNPWHSASPITQNTDNTVCHTLMCACICERASVFVVCLGGREVGDRRKGETRVKWTRAKVEWELSGRAGVDVVADVSADSVCAGKESRTDAVNE